MRYLIHAPKDSCIQKNHESVEMRWMDFDELIQITSKDGTLNNKDLIGFVGGTWTLLVYMLNKKSPKKDLDKSIYNNPNQNELIDKIVHIQKLHIKIGILQHMLVTLQLLKILLTML